MQNFLGISIGLCFYLAAFVVGMFLLARVGLRKEFFFILLILSGVEHVSFNILYSFSVFGKSDSIVQFYNHASPQFVWWQSTQLVQWMVWWVKELLVGDSVQGVFLTFGSFSYLGGVLYVCLYRQLSQKMSDSFGLNGYPESVLPYVVLFLWPSFAFWSSGLGKDSLCFFLIPLAFLTFFNLRKSLLCGLVFILAVGCMSIIRPYLFMALSYAFILLSIIGARLSIFSRVFLMLCASFLAFYLIPKVLGFVFPMLFWGGVNYGGLVALSSFQIGAKLGGTHVPIFITGLSSFILWAPFLFLANLFLPLFIFAHNATAYISSCENLILLMILLPAIKNVKYVRFLLKSNSTLFLMATFSFFGLLLISMINSNLGLAVRMKIMFVPSFMMVAFLSSHLAYCSRLLKQNKFYYNRSTTVFS